MSSISTDETILCCNCEKTFTFTEAEQDHHRSKGYNHKPKRCAECRKKRTQGLKRHNGRGNGRGNGKRISADNAISDRDLMLEIGKSIGELRVHFDSEIKSIREDIHKIRKSVDEALFED